MAEAGFSGSLGIIKSAYGGTNLAEQWNVDARDGLCLYTRMLGVVTRAKQAEPDVEIAGFAWLQGESDASQPWMAEAYKTNFSRLIDRMRADLRVPRLPVVVLEFARLVDAEPARREREESILRDLVQLARNDGYIRIVGTSGLTMQDKIHWDAEGQLEAGSRLAVAMQELL